MSFRFLPVLLAVLLVTFQPPARAAAHFVVTDLVAGDLFTFDDTHLTQLINRLQTAGFNTVTTTIAWSVVEPQAGVFDFSPYIRVFDKLTSHGLNLLVILDSSMREILDQDIRPTGAIAVPEWLLKRFPDATAEDFSHQRSDNLDYADRRHLPFLDRFYRTTLAFLRRRYGNRVIAIAPGIMQELELKYAQWGYRWESYTTAAQDGFATWLKAHGSPAAKLPVINYSNELGHYRPHIEPLFAPFMRYRENALKDYVCRLSRIIRSYDYPAAGYFGQSMTSHDGIYALGIIEDLTGCLDSITVDYNYFDGWHIELDPYIIPLLVNYAHNLGYPKIMAGLYLEKYYSNNGNFIDRYLQTTHKTLRLLTKQNLSKGVEIGNVKLDDLKKLQSLKLDALKKNQNSNTSAKSNESYRIGIVASKWTFYLWHGEHSFGRNLIEDDLLANYRVLTTQPDFSVDVLGEHALLTRNLSQYDALILPLQTTLSPAALTAIRRYFGRGGRLVQDVQFDAFDTAGRPLTGWVNDLFGIGGISWHDQTATFIIDHRRLTLPKQNHSYFTYTLLAPRPGHRLLMRLFNNPREGLMLRGDRTLTFGFLPLLINDPGKRHYWQHLYVSALRHLLNGKEPGCIPTVAGRGPSTIPAGCALDVRANRRSPAANVQ